MPAHMENPGARGGATGARDRLAERLDGSNNTPDHRADQVHARLERVAADVVQAMRRLKASGESSFPTPGAVAAVLALMLRARLGPLERLGLASGSAMSLDADEAERLAEAILHDLDGGEVTEGERMRQQWAAHCARSSYRRPRLTREEQRRAERIRLDDTPRAALAEAWHAASARDRHDFLERVTGR